MAERIFAGQREKQIGEVIRMQKKAQFVFNGDPMCFIHVLLNALDAAEKKYDIRVIIEGAATKLIPDLEKPENALHQLWKR